MKAAILKKSSLGRIACPNQECSLHGHRDAGNIALHGHYEAKGGLRRRFCCKACGKTFGARTGTAYAGLQRSMRAFDRVAGMSVEGISKAAIARIECLSWNTVTRWLERAARFARLFNCAKTPGFVLRELQLDEMIEDEDVIKKILKHLGLWDQKARPPPKANSPPEYHIDYTDSQLPVSDNYLYVDTQYPQTFTT